MAQLSRLRRLIPCLCVLALLATACSSDSEGVETVTVGAEPVESGMPATSKPQRGGQLVYGVESETDSYCLPEAELAISGMQVARSLYDTLVVPDDEGGYAPYLAKSIDHSSDHKTWTITLREGVLFHDGTKLDASVVKKNLDAYRGQYSEYRQPLLLMFALNNIADVTVENELTVKVTTVEPWVAFEAALYGSGRLGIMAEAQVEADAEACATKPIGTGPFRFLAWRQGQYLKVTRNTNYWHDAPDGKPYPYLNAIEFRPITSANARISALNRGEINMLHTSSISDMDGTLRILRDSGDINLLVSQERTESEYLMVNVRRPLLAEVETRRAIAQALDREALNEIGNAGFATIADGPFAPKVMGYVEDAGFPAFDPEAAKKTVAAISPGTKPQLELMSSSSPDDIVNAIQMREMLEDVGFDVTLDVEMEVDLIERTIAGEYDLVLFRNQPGEDPDQNMIWWASASDNPVNFGGWSDAVIDENLAIGRHTADPEIRRKAYETINRRFAEQLYNVYLWYTPWAIAEAPNVHGILGSTLPDGSAPAKRIVTSHPLTGIWIDRS